MRLRSILLGTLVSTVVLGAESSKYSLVANFYTGLNDVDLEALHLTFRDVGFESAEPVLGFKIDLNSDGTSDHVLRGPCGNGVCTLRLIDGKTKMPIAWLVGRPVIVHSALATRSTPGAPLSGSTTTPRPPTTRSAAVRASDWLTRITSPMLVQVALK